MSDDELPRFGSGERGLFTWNPETRQMEKTERKEAPRLHYVITDEMPAMEYMGNANREMFTSKSAYRRRLKEDGFIETGGEIPKFRPPEVRDDRRDDIERAYHDIKENRAYFSERERETCRREEREYQEYMKRNWKH